MCARKVLFFSLVVILLAFAGGTLSADVIHKYDGGKIEGKITKETEDFVWIKTKFGTYKIDRYDIEKIEYGEVEEDSGEEKKPEKKPGGGKKAKAKPELKPKVEKTKPPRKKTTSKKPSAPDKLLSESNLNKLKKICRERMKAYEGVPWQQAHTYNTEHFNIRCNTSKKVADYYAWLLEKLYAKYTKVFAAFNPKKIKCSIEIYRNYTEFRQVKGVRFGVGGFYQPGRHVLCAFHGTMGSLKTDQILAHEGCHLFQDLFLSNFRFAPIWIIEGMAVLMEAAEIDKKDGEVHIRGVSPDRLSNLQNMIKTGKNIPLSKVMTTPHAQFRAQHYAHAGMFSIWLIRDAKAAKRVLQYLYNDYLRIAAGGKGQQPRQIRPDDFEAVCRKYKTSLSELEEKWKKWVLKQEIKRPGKVSRGKFFCKEYGIEVKAPPGWKIDLNVESSRDLCIMKKKGSEARIYISVSGTFGTPNLDEFLSVMDNARSKRIQRLQNYKDHGRKKITFLGLEGYESNREYTNPDSTVTKEHRRYRTIAVSAVDVIYSITGMFPPDEFDALQEEYRYVVDSFRLNADQLK